MAEAFITGDMLRWACKRRFGDPAVAAEKLRVKIETLDAWEKEDKRPSLHRAQEMAKKLQVPFGFLFLSKPPTETLPLPDLRAKSKVLATQPSPDFLEVLYDALRKRDWFHDYLEREEAIRVPFVGKFTLDTPIAEVAADITKTLRLAASVRADCKDSDGFYRELAQRAEEARVLVLRNGVVGNDTHRPLNPCEFQGFAISDELAPLVFVNQNDFLSAQIFTLVHELAHIWTGISGVSLPEYLSEPSPHSETAERVANSIAAEVLVPAIDLRLSWKNHLGLDRNIDALATKFRVSRFVILRRAYDEGQITLDAFRAKYAELGTAVRRKGGGGGYASVFSRNSKAITTTLLYSVLEGRTFPKEAAQLLNVRMVALPGLMKHLIEHA